MTTITDPDTGAAFDAPATRHDDVGQAGEIARLRAENERLRAAVRSLYKPLREKLQDHRWTMKRWPEGSMEHSAALKCANRISPRLRAADAALKETSHD